MHLLNRQETNEFKRRVLLTECQEMSNATNSACEMIQMLVGIGAANFIDKLHSWLSFFKSLLLQQDLVSVGDTCELLL